MEHAVVAVLLTTAQNEVVLQLRDNKPAIPYPNCWTLFGGAVEAGETPDAAVRRELWEELELELPLTYWKAYTCPARTIPGKQRTTNHVYTARLTRDPHTLTLREGQALRCFARDDALALRLAFEQHFLLREYYAG